MAGHRVHPLDESAWDPQRPGCWVRYLELSRQSPGAPPHAYASEPCPTSLPTVTRSIRPSSVRRFTQPSSLFPGIGILPTFRFPTAVLLQVGEMSPHVRPRISRIGNHPLAQDRLRGRLGDHYATRRDAKNGSVFRRYLGGALLRRDGMGGCLEPGPGAGHWERAKGRECDDCAGYEERVTEYLRSRFLFACVRIDDQALRNHLEHRLIASVAQCRECTPSSGWLGLHAYPEKVRASGLWNANDVDGPGATREDLERFRGLAEASLRGRTFRTRCS
jgi:hypothetical protein